MATSYLSDLCITEDINERRRTPRSALTVYNETYPTEAYTLDEVWRSRICCCCSGGVEQSPRLYSNGGQY